MFDSKMEFVKSKIFGQSYRYCYDLGEEFGKLGVRILHLSDLHLRKSKRKFEEIERYFEYLKNQRFDFVFITGDVVDKEVLALEDSTIFQNFFKGLKAKLGKFYVEGNHDKSLGEEKRLEKVMKGCGFEKVVKVKKIKVGKTKVSIFGNEQSSVPNTKSQNSEISIKLVHSLDEVKYPKNYDLILSGHLHAGELNFGFFDGVSYLRLKKEYENLNGQRKGHKRLGKCMSIISPGMNTSNPLGFRLFTEKEGVVEILL